MKKSVGKREKVFYLSGMFGQNMIYADEYCTECIVYLLFQ